MPVVINEFEVVSEAPPAARRGAEGEAKAAEKKQEEAGVTVQALRAVALKSLRVWAH